MKWFLTEFDSSSSKYLGFKFIGLGSMDLYVEEKQSHIVPNDNRVFENEDYIFVLSGVIISPSDFFDILEKHIFNSTEVDSYSVLLNLLGQTWGFFTGLLVDKKKKKTYGFNNHLGDSPFFYYESKQLRILSNDLWLIVKVIKSNKIEIVPEIYGINQILKFGYINDNKTLVKCINRLNPGQIIQLYQNEFQHKYYYQIDFNQRSSISLSEMLDQTSVLLTESVRELLDYAMKVGIKRIYVDISAGLDSRLVNFAIKKSNPNIEIINIHYSTTYSDEFKIASEISAHLNNTLIFSSMDFPGFIRNHKETVRLNYGLAGFHSSTNMNLVSGLLSVNGASSIVLNGQLGDVVLGSYLSDPESLISKIDLNDKALINQVLDTGLSVYNYLNQEDFLFTGRGLHGILSSHTIRSNYMFPLSPLLSPNFLRFSLSVPVKYRANHYFYYMFLDKFYPETLKFKSNRFNMSTIKGKFDFYSYYGKRRLKKIANKSLSTLGIKDFFKNKETMNPFDDWIMKYPKLKSELLDFIQANKELISELSQGVLIDEHLSNHDMLFNIVTILDFFMIVNET